MALVDVVIPVCGPAPGLREAVDSALSQGVRVRVIVVDANGGEALEAAPDGPRILKVPAPGATLAGARNAGIQRGRSPFVAFLDADTFWLPGKLLRQIGALRPDVALSCTDYFTFGARGAIVRPTMTNTHTPASGHVLAGLLRDNYIHPSTVLVRRGALPDPADPLDVTLGRGAERDLFYRIAARHEVIFDPAVLVAVRRREVTEADRIAVALDMARVYEKALGWLERPGLRAIARRQLVRLYRDLGWLYSTRDLAAAVDAYARSLRHGGVGAVTDLIKAPVRRMLLSPPDRSAAA